MTMDLADIDEDGLEDAIVPDRDFFPQWHRRQDTSGLLWSAHSIHWPSDMGRPKAVHAGDVDLDGKLDVIVTAVLSVESAALVGVGWLQQPETPFSADWTPYNIAGPEGEKFDRIELADLDADGDLDVITTEERNNSFEIYGLGVLWYENPTIELDGDVTRDGRTNSTDLAVLIAAWGNSGPQLEADLNNSGSVDSVDLAILLAAWGHEDLDYEPPTP